MSGLKKSVGRIKADVKSRVDSRVFSIWWNRVDNISKRFKKLYSDKNNEFYNYLYKTSKVEDNSWYNILNDVSWIQENVFVEFDNISDLIEGFEEGDLEKLFTTEMKAKGSKAETTEEIKANALKRRVKVAECDVPKNTKKPKDISFPQKKDGDVHVTNDDKKDLQPSGSQLFEDILSDDENEIINGALVRAIDNDEVGVVDMNNFIEFIERYIS